jgi:hypothetical protein
VLDTSIPLSHLFKYGTLKRKEWNIRGIKAYGNITVSMSNIARGYPMTMLHCGSLVLKP